MTFRFEISIPVSGTEAGKAESRCNGTPSSSTGNQGENPMAPFNLKVNGVNPTPISGNYLAHNHASTVIRAFIGADLVSGVRTPVGLNQNQAAGLARVSPVYVHWALKRASERAEIERGHAPLIPPHGEVVVPKTNGATLTTNGIDDAGLIQLVRSVGVNRVLNAAIAVDAAIAVERAQH
jgi:hypothetical protein